MELDTASSDTDNFSDGSSIGIDTLNPSRLLQNALRHIDGLIENCEENKRHSTVADESKLLVLSTELRVHIEELEQLQCDNESDVPEETLKVIFNWSKRQLGVQTCEDEVERLRKELKVEKEKHKQLSLAEAEVRRLHVKLQTHEHETQRLQEICDRLEDELRQKQKPALGAKGRKRSISDLRDVNKPSKMKHSTSVPEIEAYHIQSESMPNLLESSSSSPDHQQHHQQQQQKSTADQAKKGWVSKLFGRHRVRSHDNKASMLEAEPLFNLPVQSERAQLFYTLEEDGLLVWIQEMGLSRYAQGIIRHAPSGAELVKLITSHHEHLAGITHPLHKKKLELAIRDAFGEQAGATSHLDHHWVADWLVDIGLPQYRDAFLESLVDGNILNQITYDELTFLQVNNSFHQISLKRAIQGLRLASYRKNYLRTWSSVKGANQVLLWPASRVSDWLKRIDLGDYTGHLEGAGLHGALMVLEVGFTEESLARLLGIPPGKVFLRKHLLRRFLDVVGPVVAQSKIDAQQVKNFTPVDPIGKPRTDKKKPRHKKDSTSGNDALLCPLDLKVARHISRSSPDIGEENTPPKDNLIE